MKEGILLEYGIIYNSKQEENQLESTEYIFCAFKDKNFFYATDPYNNRILILDRDSGKVSFLFRSNWFPRWIQVAEDGSIIYLDSENRTIGKIINGKVVMEKEISIKEPLFIMLTNKNTLLIGGKGESPLIEIDENMVIINRLQFEDLSLRSAEMLSDDRILVCDDQRQQVFIIDWDGNIYWEYGVFNSPGSQKNHLFSPRFCTCRNEMYYIADGMNDRVLCINHNGDIIFTYKCDEFGNSLWVPSCIQIEGNVMIITDSHNKRIIDVDMETWISSQWGNAIVEEFKLKGPRGLAISKSDSSIYIADTLHDRLVHLNSELQYVEEKSCVFSEGYFFWPRAVYIADGLLYVADSRNKRIVVLDFIDFNIVREIDNYWLDSKECGFLDLHDIRVYKKDILLCDALGNKVMMLNELNECVWQYGNNGEIKDPHQAVKSNDGNFIISDTGNNRIIKVSKDAEIIFIIDKLSNGQLSSPRWAEEIGDLLLITDSGNNRIILVDCKGNIKHTYGGECGLGNMQLRLPRYAIKWKDSLIISDTRNNRVVKVPWSIFSSEG